MLVSARDQPTGLLGGHIDALRLGEGAPHQRVEPHRRVRQVAQRVLQPAAPTVTYTQTPGCMFAAGHRAEDEWYAEPAQEAGLADADEGDVVRQIEAVVPMPLLGHPVGAPLPEKIIEVNTTIAFLPPVCPTREIVVDEMQSGPNRFVLATESQFYGLTVVAAGKYPNVVPPSCQCQRPVPTNSRFRTLARFASIGREQDAK